MVLTNRSRLTIPSTLPLILALILTFVLHHVAQAATNAESEIEPITLGERTLDFAGHQWNVKAGCEIGPGPNCWSDSEESVWIDDEMQLHLKIRQIDGVWHSSEVSTTTCTQYGMHRFYLIGRLDLLDKNVVAAPFLYSDDQHEIDIEFAKWGVDNPTMNAQYAIQPADKPGNLEPFPIQLNGAHSTHSIDWSASSIQFMSIHGHHPEPPTPAHVIHQWSYTGDDIPAEADCLKIHINFWLFRGNAPANGEEVELIVSNVDSPSAVYLVFLPLVMNMPGISIIATASEVSGDVGPALVCNSNYKVALYALTDIWYVQPREDLSDIEINSDCTWHSPTNRWDVLGAHLVTAEFSPPPTIGPPVPACPPLDVTDPNVMATACFP